MSTLETLPDDALVAATLAGDRHAFGRIVERYQRLLCSLAYSATGELALSEDVAQEAFVEAWRHLKDLREPEKLRPWLCGILRHKVSRLRRADGREPVRQADSLEAAAEIETTDEPAPDLTIRKEEQALLWKALEGVPELYREPLVLYYREHQSIEHVAVSLELTEDAVKQRLARGRKILQEQVLAFVEGALERSTPGKLFTIAVLAALPALAVPTTAKAAAVGAGMGAGTKAVAGGGAVAKATGFATVLASNVGLVNAWLGLRTALDQSRTPKERREVVKATVLFVGSSFAFLGALWLLRWSAWRWWDQREVLAWVAQGSVVVFALAWTAVLWNGLKYLRRLRSAERRAHPESFDQERDRAGSSHTAYRSRLTLLGIPLVHIRFSTPDEGEAPVVGWVAGGDRAYGLVAAWGAVAVAPFSVGSVAVGIFALGNVSFGVISLGTVAFGGLSIGCAAMGLKAYGWLSALGWHSAQGGGFAVAHTAAEGSIALAAHANDATAHTLLANPNAELHGMLFYGSLVIFSLGPLLLYSRAIKRRNRRAE